MHTELLIYKNIYLFLKHFTGLLILTEIFYTPQSSVDDDLVLNWLYSLSELLSKPTWAAFFFKLISAFAADHYSTNKDASNVETKTKYFLYASFISGFPSGKKLSKGPVCKATL